MSAVQEIERAIANLTEEEVAELRAWMWDRDIERDVEIGRLEEPADEALREHRAGKTKRL
jgi:hypothetical protein